MTSAYPVGLREVISTRPSQNVVTNCFRTLEFLTCRSLSCSGLVGFGPTTFGTLFRRSIQLSYSTAFREEPFSTSPAVAPHKHLMCDFPMKKDRDDRRHCDLSRRPYIFWYPFPTEPLPNLLRPVPMRCSDGIAVLRFVSESALRYVLCPFTPTRHVQ